MSVAEKPITTEAPTQNPSAQLALRGILGGIFLLASLWVVLAGVPLVWNEVLQVGQIFNPFLSGALLLIAVLGVAVALGYLGLQLEKAHDERGLREGAFVSAILIYIIARITLGIGMLLSNAEMGTVGLVIMIGVGLALLFGLYKWMSLPGFAAWLGRLKDAGWFETNVVKGNQGVKTRRLTVIALLILGFWGIITLINQRLLGIELPGVPNDWVLNIPFTAGPDETPNTLPLIFSKHMVVPILLAIVLVWFSWRIVNLPTFTDFLIATEAEMNKVSWSSRKRLFQDTVVVLTTLFLVTLFLFVIDLLWIQILSNEWIQVLLLNTREEQMKLKETARW